MEYGTENIGTGAYTGFREIEVAAHTGLYASSYELVRRHSVTKRVLDLGCSDGVGTFGLGPEFVARGIDFDAHSVREANTIATARAANGEGPRYKAHQADLLSLPPRLVDELHSLSIDCVLLLDVLEHFTWIDALRVLDSARSLAAPEFTVVVSMPVFSMLSIETHLDLLRTMRRGRRPDAGILDRTHRILRGRRSHRRLFAEADFAVVEEYQTDHVVGTSGNWTWQVGGTERTHLASEVSRRDQAGRRAASLLTRAYLASADHRVRRRIVQGAVIYQGLYVLRPSS